EERRGIKLTYCTDTRPTDVISSAAKDADLAIFEGMYGDDERLEAAKVKHHMIFSEAAALAAAAGAKELWLTHFSPSETDPEQWIDNARILFPNSHCGKCGMHTVLNYPDDEDSTEA
ncbi:MAG: ribonuclease Z, partial [Solobacterium sp.]|nr:ribonuclease Z [Solobacterium sp.]